LASFLEHFSPSSPTDNNPKFSDKGASKELEFLGAHAEYDKINAEEI